MQTIRKQNLLAAALALAAVQSALPVSAGEPAAKRYNVLLIIRRGACSRRAATRRPRSTPARASILMQ